MFNEFNIVIININNFSFKKFLQNLPPEADEFSFYSIQAPACKAGVLVKDIAVTGNN